MRFIRFQIQGEQPQFGWMLKDKIGLISGSPVGEYRRSEASLNLDQVKLLAPIIPSKVIGIGRNYEEHAHEQGVDVPEYPTLFFKPPSSIIGPEDKIILPPQSKQVEHEAELAVVIGKRAHWVTAENANKFIFGYTIADDVTARDLQQRDGQWTRAKGFDTFCPIGPWIETEMDASDTMITCHVNGELRQMSSTRDMVFPIPQLIAYISSIMTLEPGDIILTGTPAGVGQIKTGDKIEVIIDGIGKLSNEVQEEKGLMI
jgi:2-keto-4-pentenoate hydratase/2-oxohepta-3-ene-1,7-dioic acid hydratase in catechol pathway